MLERLAILFPERTIAAEDLPERYRIAGTAGWTGGGVVMVPAMESHAVESVVDARPGASTMDSVSDEFADELLESDEAALPRGGIDLKDHLSAIEIGLIRKALEEADGTVAGATAHHLDPGLAGLRVGHLGYERPAGTPYAGARHHAGIAGAQPGPASSPAEVRWCHRPSF